MFAGCISLKSININFFEMNSMKDISFMFKNCSKLTYVKLPMFDKAKRIKSKGLFFGCTSLLHKENIIR